MAQTFLTVAEELLIVADSCVDALKAAGYSVTIEDRSRVECPYLPTITCVRGNATMFVEICSSVPDRAVLREWTAFCKSQSTDTRFAIALAEGVAIAEDPVYLTTEGIGVFLISNAGVLSEIHPPKDQGMDIELPSLTSYPNSVRAALGEAWDEIRRGQWREGFDAACIVFERHVRAYVVRHKNHGRLAFVKANGKPRTYTDDQVDRMTMGQLVHMLDEVVNPNHGDSMLHDLLDTLNPDRIKVAHRRGSDEAERDLRAAVPLHLWRIVRGVSESLK